MFEAQEVCTFRLEERKGRQNYFALGIMSLLERCWIGQRRNLTFKTQNAATLPHETLQYSTHCDVTRFDAMQPGTWLPTVRNNMAFIITSLLQGLQLTNTFFFIYMGPCIVNQI